jgi:predicted small secreted protein
MTINKLITLTVFAFSLTLAGCNGGGDTKKAGDKQAAKKPDDKQVKTPEEPEGPQAPPLDPKVEQAVTVANDIAANPGDADTILSKAGLDRESFEKLLYEIARDPELSKSYAIAREA